MNTMPMRLSNRQAKEADRVGGIELMIAWPHATLGPERGAEVGNDQDRDCTPIEKAEAERLIGPACRERNLVPVHSRVARVYHHGAYRLYLAVTIIGARWVHASTQRRGRTLFMEEAPQCPAN